MRAVLLFLLTVLATLTACGKTATTRGDDSADEEPGCTIPAAASDLVLGVTRHVVPIGREIRVEAGELTTSGRCSAKTECVHVTPERMADLVARVRAMGRIRHQRSATSPHYGFRAITARWSGGACSFADGSTAPIDARGSGKLDAVYDAIALAITEAPGRERDY